jgi:hypothetical protein
MRMTTSEEINDGPNEEEPGNEKSSTKKYC